MKRTLVDEDRVNRAPTPVLGVLIPSTKGKHVLVVEDDADTAETLCTLLGDEGYQADSALSGADAIAKVHAAPPSLVLLDVGLPDKDGLAVALEVAADRRSAHVPILFLSGVRDLPERVRRSRLLQFDFLRKPYGAQELLARVERCIAQAEVRARLRIDALIDELTGLGNMRLLDERLEVEAARRARYGTPVAVVVADLDGLKRINDKHGHLTGSAVLRAVGDALRAEVRETDVAIRYGGDEFVVLLPHTGLQDAEAFCERLQRRVAGLNPNGIPISVSIGIAAFDERSDDVIRDTLARADAAAYRAKRDGGNRWVSDNGAVDPTEPIPQQVR
jgi:two-component system, cell cycle response regulator